MKLHKEGYKIVFTTLLCWLLFTLLNFHFFYVYRLLFYLLLLLFLIPTLLVVRFFRFPNRKIKKNSDTVLSVCDGKVCAIEEVEEPAFFKGKVKVVSIFMSIYNVHANYYPIDGEIVFTRYYNGKYLVAFNPKSSEVNERNSIAIQHKNGKSVLFTQVAGYVARRIVSYANVGEMASQGENMGFIKFGSRIDLYLPLDSEIKVNIGDTTRAQQTVIATL